jgi:hypothetical protein
MTGGEVETKAFRMARQGNEEIACYGVPA